jgi:CsoR family transcriptional regulator, copper-sensing transcriptional repressor
MDCCETNGGHPSHADELKSLNRICGQLEAIKRMIEERKYCPEILTQLRAARSAIKSVETKILEAHLNTCVEESLSRGNAKDKKAKISELAELFKRFD